MLRRHLFALLCTASVLGLVGSNNPGAEPSAPAGSRARVGEAPSSESVQALQYDLLIRHARVLDGSGNPWFGADVAVKDGRIAAIGDLRTAAAARTIDAAGCFLAPGFIDIHSHSDSGLGDANLRYNLNMVAQGITLSVVNQDGRSPWPIRDQKLVTRSRASVRTWR